MLHGWPPVQLLQFVRRKEAVVRGDEVEAEWRLISGHEAVDGLLLFLILTCFYVQIYIACLCNLVFFMPRVFFSNFQQEFCMYLSHHKQTVALYIQEMYRYSSLGIPFVNL
jgi:hypothetical protein